jgi:hypothetical protein
MSKTKTITSSTKSTTSGKKTSNKKTKDPNAPKRYRTAYILFSIEKRDEIKVMNFHFISIFVRFFYYFRVKIPDYYQKKFYPNLVLYGKRLMLL